MLAANALVVEERHREVTVVMVVVCCVVVGVIARLTIDGLRRVGWSQRCFALLNQ